jgi:vacuolar-type H+-ATPase subunit H
MSKNTNNNSTSITTEHAINLVLEAEKNAQHAVEKCQVEAEQLLQQARQKAQRIKERTDKRITHIHQSCHRFVADEVERLEKEERERAKQQQSEEVDLERVTTMVEQIAKLLTEDVS